MHRRIRSSSELRSAVSAAATCLLVVVAGLSGCGGKPRFDKELEHTPESLVHEFMIRYETLPDQATAEQREKLAKQAAAQAKLPDVDSGSGKSSRKEAAIKSQALAQSQTLDNLVDALDRRLGLVKGMSKREAAAKVAELIDYEPNIRDEDREVIMERLNK